ncbi:MAG: hypothetical protein V1679_00980 [Candidatus Peregrinibacteria bacterium]
MITTVSVDKEIRNSAAKKAKQDKLSVSAVVRILLMDYANGKIQIGTRLAEPIEVDKETQKMMDDTVAEWNKKK